jgi:hypothetical protein
MLPRVGSFYEANAGGKAERHGITKEHGAACYGGGHGGQLGRAWGKKQREKESKLERERDGGGRGLLILSSRGSVGGGVHLLAGSTARAAPGSSFSCQRKRTNRYGGLGLGWLLAAARRRQIRGGMKPSGLERAQERKKKGKQFSCLCFSGFGKYIFGCLQTL